MPMTPEGRVDDELEDELEAEVQNFSDFIAERPLVAVGIAAMFGFVLARIVF
ncbi:MAG TPA: hypothetical protein VHZ78_14390 [Rhizomicrobium sp.]|jgi:ElaB/YqjD/DUF883 family membrane-anchored ribosome-binding protein|nr:hypothetical protein [Rhizomicrobium sp.]